jgi:prefoldin subunit 2
VNWFLKDFNEKEQEKEEHLLVINTISKMEPTRKCFKLIGGILVEKTVETTLPLVEGNKEGIVNLMEQLGKTYKVLLILSRQRKTS